MSQKPSTVKIAASILAADFRCLREEIAAVESAGADLLHLDVMDGSFVPNISFGAMVVQAVDRLTSLPLNVHLMIQRPDLYVEQFVRSGADYIVIHYEAQVLLERTLQQIRDLNCRAGISVNPGTPLTLLEPLLKSVDHVLLMSVDPGFGGQKFIPKVFEKIKQLRATLKRLQMMDVEIAVDGGVNAENAKLVIESGADVLVAGSAIFQSTDYDQAITSLRGSKGTESCSRS
jgi:ribulose-phosphate 3-epimerase